MSDQPVALATPLLKANCSHCLVRSLSTIASGAAACQTAKPCHPHMLAHFAPRLGVVPPSRSPQSQAGPTQAAGPKRAKAHPLGCPPVAHLQHPPHAAKPAHPCHPGAAGHHPALHRSATLATPLGQRQASLRTPHRGGPRMELPHTPHAPLCHNAGGNTPPETAAAAAALL